MRIPRLYVNQELATGAVVDLDSDASRYLGSVLRMEAGRPLIVFNGKGGEYLAMIKAASKKMSASALVNTTPRIAAPP